MGGSGPAFRSGTVPVWRMIFPVPTHFRLKIFGVTDKKRKKRIRFVRP